ncbi:MAG: hypothetical protein DRN71_02195 [Candidatus Nanohalarchaeota archaeon]|nr:MAG: hypothetical protein DRN71_02195 [Candidatus Nanohaloarchaeota archaeon]
MILLIAAIILAIVAFAFWSEKKRREELKTAAHRMAFSFSPEKDVNLTVPMGNMKLFTKGHSRKAHNIMKGETNRVHWTVFDYEYTVGYGRHSHTYNLTVASAQLHDLSLPKFSLGPESFFDKLGDMIGYKDIDFDSNPEFSKRYLLKGMDESAIRKLFTHEILHYFEKRTGTINIETDKNSIIVYTSGRRVDPKDMRAFITSASEAVNLFKKGAHKF